MSEDSTHACARCARCGAPPASCSNSLAELQSVQRARGAREGVTGVSKMVASVFGAQAGHLLNLAIQVHQAATDGEARGGHGPGHRGACRWTVQRALQRAAGGAGSWGGRGRGMTEHGGVESRRQGAATRPSCIPAPLAAGVPGRPFAGVTHDTRISRLDAHGRFTTCALPPCSAQLSCRNTCMSMQRVPCALHAAAPG